MHAFSGIFKLPPRRKKLGPFEKLFCNVILHIMLNQGRSITLKFVSKVFEIVMLTLQIDGLFTQCIATLLYLDNTYMTSCRHSEVHRDEQDFNGHSVYVYIAFPRYFWKRTWKGYIDFFSDKNFHVCQCILNIYHIDVVCQMWWSYAQLYWNVYIIKTDVFMYNVFKKHL